MISSLPGKALRMLVDIARLAERFNNAFSKPSLVNMISKDANLVFYLSVYPLLNTLQSDYDVILMFVLIQRHKRRHSKSATSS